MCHAVLQDPDFFLFLLRIDEEFAAETRDARCPHCGGVLHSARYPRKPRGCPAAVLEEYSWRFSFTCAQCDQRATPASVRFLGRRVYLAVVLTRISAPGSATAQYLASVLAIPLRTLQRWRAWWNEDFLRTPFWQSMRERFTTPIPAAAGNASLMTKELRHTLCDHAAGNYRIFTAMAGELLMNAAQRELPVLDEKLYLQVFARPETHSTRRAAAAR